MPSVAPATYLTSGTSPSSSSALAAPSASPGVFSIHWWSGVQTLSSSAAHASIDPFWQTSTAEEVQKACDDHVAKQRKGQLSVTYSGRMDSHMGKASQQQIEHPPGRPEFKRAQQM